MWFQNQSSLPQSLKVFYCSGFEAMLSHWVFKLASRLCCCCSGVTSHPKMTGVTAPQSKSSPHSLVSHVVMYFHLHLINNSQHRLDTIVHSSSGSVSLFVSPRAAFHFQLVLILPRQAPGAVHVWQRRSSQDQVMSFCIPAGAATW